MHYVRLLKPPTISLQRPLATVKTLITITTDLGDDFLATDLPIYALLIREGEEPTRVRKEKAVLATAKVTWKPGTRALWVEIPKLPILALKTPVRLLISTSSEYVRSLQVQHATLDYLPEVFHAWSEAFDLDSQGGGGWVERRFSTSETVTLRICEEMGESIARHVWDAGVALAAFIRDILLLPRLQDDHWLLARRIRAIKDSGGRVIELGSGCGIVGLQLAHACPKAQVVLTDLPEAMEVLERNITIATLAPGSNAVSATLNWDEDLPASIVEQNFDLVLVSDCTYNSDSIPALVGTLAALVERSPQALVAVSMKVRHDSEAIFHELIAKAGLKQCQHWDFEISDKQRAESWTPLDIVHLYVYQGQNATEVDDEDDEKE